MGRVEQERIVSGDGVNFDIARLFSRTFESDDDFTILPRRIKPIRRKADDERARFHGSEALVERVVFGKIEKVVCRRDVEIGIGIIHITGG